MIQEHLMKDGLKRHYGKKNYKYVFFVASATKRHYWQIIAHSEMLLAMIKRDIMIYLLHYLHHWNTKSDLFKKELFVVMINIHYHPEWSNFIAFDNGRGGRVINMEGEISGINGNKQDENDLVTQNAFPQHQNSLLLINGRNKAVIKFRDPNT